MNIKKLLAVLCLISSLFGCGGQVPGYKTFDGPNQGYSTDDLYRFFAVAFGAAPGVTYGLQLLDAANAGMSLKAIVNVFTTKSQFTDTYPTTMSNVDFATKLVANVVGASASDVAKQEAVNDIVSALSIPGWTRGDVIYAVFNNLANKQASDTKWYGTATKMANQVEYAKYYTETMKGDTTDLNILRKVIYYVDQNSVTTGVIWNVINSWINASYGSNSIALQATSYLNAKNVGLSRINFPATLSTVTPDQPLAWGAGDFFKNGTLDIFTAKQNYSMDTGKYPTNTVVSNDQYKSDFQFWRKDSQGNLTLLLTYKGCLHPRKALVDDFNKDGYPDVFVSCTGYDGLVDGKSPGEKSKMLLNDGKGGFVMSDTPEAGYYHGATSADVNGDGYPDIVVADIFNYQKSNSQGSALHVLINQKNGTFVDDQTRIINFVPFANYWSVELIDIDGDGILDLVAGGDENASWKPATTTIFYGDSTGKFGATTTAIPKVLGRGTVLDFTFVVNGTKKTLYIGRTADGTDSQSWYSTTTLQAFDLTTKTATVIFDKLNTIWEAWWLPTNRNGQNGVSSYSSYKEDVFFYK